MNNIVQLLPLEKSDREQFIIDNQRAFNYGAMEEFGLRDNHFEEDGQIIARETKNKDVMKELENIGRISEEIYKIFPIKELLFVTFKVRNKNPLKIS